MALSGTISPSIRGAGSAEFTHSVKFKKEKARKRMRGSGRSPDDFVMPFLAPDTSVGALQESEQADRSDERASQPEAKQTFEIWQFLVCRLTDFTQSISF